MKTRLIALLALAGLFAACNPESKDPGKTGGGSHERSIISIAFEGQIGESTIEATDATTGTISFQIATDLVEDMSKVKVTSIVVSYGATASVKTGETIDLTTAEPVITVTSEAGDKRDYALRMDAFTESFAGCYSITGYTLVGGLGADQGWAWGTMEVCAPEVKSWCWDASGYGPTADYDDYLEIACTTINSDGTTEGTCHLWGGANAKHWNCVYQGAVNKEHEGVDLDLRGFYRNIPIGESTWKRDYDAGTITFKAKDGTETVCMIKDEDILLGLNKAGEEKKVVIAEQAFAFAVPGSQVWEETYIYTDYAKFVLHPLYMFVHVSKVEAVPAEARTEGSEGTITAVKPGEEGEGGGDEGGEGGEGGDELTLADVPGNYLLSDMRVLGNVGASAFVKIKDKNYMFNSSLDREYDNTLSVALSGATGTAVTCALEYGAGEDDAWWDRILIAEKNKLGTGDLDISNNFDQLPHGASTLTVSLADGTAAISNGTKTAGAQILLPGDTTLSGIKINIPSGNVGIVFACSFVDESTYTWDPAWEWGDFDRFYLHPLAFVMIFEKQ
ncbi:MAG: hypothetical protein KBS55_02680 [Bacteroidales bacterium]|nr:hypothetical protein [Candidatus Cryptobacteroides aphodequi]